MRSILLISAMAALVAATSCSKNGTAGPDSPDTPSDGRIKVFSTIEEDSKAPVDGNTALPKIIFRHAQVASGTALPIAFTGSQFYGSRAVGTGVITFSNGISPDTGTIPMYDMVTKKRSYLHGFYPAGTSTPGGVEWTPDGATDILVTNVWDAGTYAKQNTAGMVFGHALAHVEVVCGPVAGTALAAVHDRWGKIQEIRMLDMPSTLTMTYGRNPAAGTTLQTVKMLGSSYAAFAPIDIPATGQVVARAMVVPTNKTSFSLQVVTEKQDNLIVPVTLTDGRILEAGFKYTATLDFSGTPPPPKIGDYYYSDKTFSTTYALPAGATLLGIVYRVNPDGTGMLVEVTEAPTGTKWSTVTVPTGASSEDSGVDNTNAIKGLDPTLANYPAFKHCEDKNTGGVTGWYLPASKELRALYAGYCGLRWMASGATEANGEINDWGNGVAMPGNDTYTTARTAFNAKMTAAGVGGTNLASEYWSASETSRSFAWTVYFSTGYTTNYNDKTYTNYEARCARAF